MARRIVLIDVPGYDTPGGIVRHPLRPWEREVAARGFGRAPSPGEDLGWKRWSEEVAVADAGLHQEEWPQEQLRVLRQRVEVHRPDLLPVLCNRRVIRG